MSFKSLIADSFLKYFHFDSKFFGTIFPLVCKPGWLTIEYMRGRQKSFVEPFKLFLIISLIYFIFLPFGKKEEENKIPVKSETTMTGNKKAEKEQFSFTLQGISLNGSDRDSIKNLIDSVGLDRYFEQNYAKETIWTRVFMKQVLKIMVTKGQSFTTVLEHTASKLIFILIPVFALLLKLFYLRRKRLYFEHLIFSLHLHSFIFLCFILYLLTEMIFPFDFAFIILIILVYTFMALKNYYGQAFGKTMGKIVLMSLSYLIIGLPLFVVLLLIVAVMTF